MMFEETNRFVTNADVLFDEESIKIRIDCSSRRTSWCEDTKSTLFPVDNVNQICKHVEYSKVVFNDDYTLCFGQFLDDSNNSHSLMNVQIRGRFVEEVDVSISQDCCTNGHALQFTTRQLLNGTLEEM